MDLQTAYDTLKTAIQNAVNAVSPSPGATVRMTAKHPDVWMQQNADFPVLSLVWVSEQPGYMQGNSRWSTAHNPRAEFEVHLIVTDKTTHFSTELMTWLKVIEDAVVALSVDGDTAFSSCITNAEGYYDVAGRWAWLVATITIGAYK